MVNMSKGTVPISRAAVFDLTSALREARKAGDETLTPAEELRVTVHANSCYPVLIRRAMLYEYCNINNDVIDRLWADADKELKKRRRRKRYKHSKSLYQDSSNDNNHVGLGEILEEKVNPESSPKQEHVGEGIQKENSSPSGRSRQAHSQGERKHLRRTRRSEKFCRREKEFVDLDGLLAPLLIVQPRFNVDIGRCVGSCQGSFLMDLHDTFMTSHAVIRNQFCRLFPLKCSGLANCTPHKMASVPILRIKGKTFIAEMLYNLRVVSCRCT